MEKIIIRDSKNENIKLPYIIAIPKEMDKNAKLIVNILTPFPASGKLDEILNEMIESNSNSMDYNTHVISEKLGYPVLIPIIPRIKGFYSCYLGEQVINNDFSNMHGNIEENQEYRLKNIDKQVYHMIKDTIAQLDIYDKAIISGYSASAKFATQFSILHPDIIELNISGGTGGLSTLPIDNINGIDLPYPIGVSNIDNFDLNEFKKIRHFFYIGSDDNNNPAIPNFEESDETDSNGNTLPKRDKDGNIIYKYNEFGELTAFYPECYTDEQVRVIHKLYGDENIPRFKYNEKLYHDLGINSIHKIYQGNHTNIFRNNREEMVDDIVNFIKNC